MQQKKINPIIRWWVTPKLPFEDVFASHNFVSQWLVHPIKRRLARWYLRVLQRYTNIKVIALTGSAGKTTTIQMLSSILKLSGETIFPKESIDSVYNIPNTILRTAWGTKYLILEMSVEYVGEMDFYLWLAKPDIALVTNIFPTHTLYLGDIVGVAREKSKLVKNLPRNSVAVLNKSNKFTREMSKETLAKIVWFEEGKDPIASNLAAATAISESLGIDKTLIKKGLANYVEPKHRLNIFKHKSGALIFDDSYNSNPEAFVSALATFNKISAGRVSVAVVGDMLELGDISESAHIRIGKKINESGFKAVIGVGKLIKLATGQINSKKTKIILVDKQAEVMDFLKPFLSSKAAIFIKGSRSIGLDKLADSLK